jgi:hypothetical protein
MRDYPEFNCHTNKGYLLSKYPFKSYSTVENVTNMLDSKNNLSSMSLNPHPTTGNNNPMYPTQRKKPSVYRQRPIPKNSLGDDRDHYTWAIFFSGSKRIGH